MARSVPQNIVLVSAAIVFLHGAFCPRAMAQPSEPAVQDGDLFVGAGDNVAGAIEPALFRIRAGSAEVFCRSVADEGQPDYWNIPFDVVVDSRGRAVFLAHLGNNPFGNHFGLLRCSEPGQPAEKLGLLPRNSELDAGWPVPFPGETFTEVSGLHLRPTRTIVIDDDVDRGKPHLIDEDTYVFAASGSAGIRSISYRSSTGQWEERAVDPVGVQIGIGHPADQLPDMFSRDDATYIAGGSQLRRIKNPLRLDATAKIAGTTFSLRLDLFGSSREISETNTDDLSEPNIPSGCPPPPLPGVSDDMPYFGGFTGRPLSDLYGVVYDPAYGLVLNSQAASLAYFMTEVDLTLVDDDGDDRPAQYRNSLTGCVPTPALKFRPVPYIPSATHRPTRMAATSGGLMITEQFLARVSRVTATGPEPVVTVWAPNGIAGFPHQAGSPSGFVIVIRIDSRVDVVMTDPQGRKIGVDRLTAAAINDFGADGYDTGQGEPRYFVVKTPLPGTYVLETVGTGAGPFTVHVYSADLSRSTGEHAKVSGNASVGSTSTHEFTLAESGAVAFVNEPRSGDVNGDCIVNAVDAIFLLRYLFADGTAPDSPDAADMNSDGSVTIADVFQLINEIFGRGPLSTVRPCTEEELHRSLLGEVSSSIEFVNETGDEITIFWLNYQGGREEWARVSAGQSRIQGTFVTHPWLVTNPAGQCLGIYLPEEVPTRAVIQSPCN